MLCVGKIGSMIYWEPHSVQHRLQMAVFLRDCPQPQRVYSHITQGSVIFTGVFEKTHFRIKNKQPFYVHMQIIFKTAKMFQSVFKISCNVNIFWGIHNFYVLAHATIAVDLKDYLA